MNESKIKLKWTPKYFSSFGLLAGSRKKNSTMPKSPRLWHLGPPSLLQLRSSARSKTFARLRCRCPRKLVRKDTSRSGVGPTDHIDALAGSRNHVRDQRFRDPFRADTDVFGEEVQDCLLLLGDQFKGDCLFCFEDVFPETNLRVIAARDWQPSVSQAFVLPGPR